MKKKRNILNYVDVEASEGSEGSSYEISEDLAPEYEEEVGWEDMGPESLSNEEETETESEDGSVESRPKQRDQPINYLPNIYSPKLFLVRVPPGKEYVYSSRISVLPNILSVIYKEELKGYLYVEAINQRVLKEVLKSRHVALIPQNEMMDVFFSSVTFGKYGRIKSGKYKGDICEIIQRINDEMLRVRLVPRINNKKELFNPDNYQCSKSQGYFIYKKDSYKNGFLEKDILVRNVIPIVNASLEELEIFEPKKIFKNSQKVVITKGEFKNEEGIILRMDHNGVLVDLNNFGRQFIEFDLIEPVKEETLDFSVFNEEKRVKPAQILRKRRDPLINKEVTIRKGKFKGYKGVITHTYRDKLKIFISTNNKDVNLEMDDVIIEDESIIKPTKGVFEEKGFRTPAQSSGFKTPGYQTPGFKAPGYNTPGYKTPGYKTPGYQTPGYKTPGYKTPGYNTPGMEMHTPGFRTPGAEHRIPSHTTNNEFNLNFQPKDLNVNTSSNKGLFKGALIFVDDKKKEIIDSNNDEYICTDGKYKKSFAKFVPPEKYDTVCFMTGENKGEYGLVVAITGEECVVRLHEKPINCKIYEISRVENK